jgi:hypothetical protein
MGNVTMSGVESGPGKVALFKAKVDVRATAPGMLVTP